MYHYTYLPSEFIFDTYEECVIFAGIPNLSTVSIKYYIHKRLKHGNYTQIHQST